MEKIVGSLDLGYGSKILETFYINYRGSKSEYQEGLLNISHLPCRKRRHQLISWNEKLMKGPIQSITGEEIRPKFLTPSFLIPLKSVC